MLYSEESFAKGIKYEGSGIREKIRQQMMIISKYIHTPTKVIGANLKMTLLSPKALNTFNQIRIVISAFLFKFETIIKSEVKFHIHNIK